MDSGLAAAVARYELYIDGAWRPAGDGATFASRDPASDAVWAEVAEATADDVDAAVEAAQRAFETGAWPRLSARERGHALRRLARAIEPLAEGLGETETRDTGKLYKETRWQATNLAETYDYYASLADKLQGDLPPVPEAAPLAMVFREPLGVVAAIVPWNSQLHLAAAKIGPALAAGNTMVLKASEDASGALLEFVKAVEEADLPPGVFNLVTGGARPCGERLVSHPKVRRIAFTGGVETARKIIPQTANNIARLTLELGGKSPVVVYDDADLDNAVNGIVAAIFGASGQSCAAGSRLLLQEGIYDAVLARVVARAKTIRLGDPMDPATEMGPLATKAQVERIERLLAQSLEKGATLLCGGGRPEGLGAGYYFQPTVVAFDHQDFPLVRNELFGPLLSVLRFKDEAEAVALAKDSDYAFAGGVFSRDFGKAYRTARAIPAGRFWINTYRTTSVMVPFGGLKNSGYGREGGIDALRDYTETKGIFVELSGQPGADPFVMR